MHQEKKNKWISEVGDAWSIYLIRFKTKIPSSSITSRCHWALCDTHRLQMEWEQLCIWHDSYTYVSSVVQWQRAVVSRVQENQEFHSRHAHWRICQYERGETSLKGAHNNFRQLITGIPNSAPFGAYTTIENMCIPMLRSNSVVLEMFYQCPNGHYVHHLDDHDAFFSTGRNEYESIAQWISLDTSHIEIACQHCGHAVGLQCRFWSTPLLLVFSMPTGNSTTLMNNTLKISIKDQNHKYLLMTVVYYRHHHFMNHIITCDRRIWFYDGMAIINQQVQPALECIGSIHSQQDRDLLYNCRGNNACAVIYAHQLEWKAWYDVSWM